jgi:AraC-like DNA-binding protein
MGPLIGATSIILAPLRVTEDGPEAQRAIMEAAEGSYATEISRAAQRLAFGAVRPLEEASLSWAEALGRLWGGGGGGGGAGVAGKAKPFEADEDFLVDLSEGSPERAGLELEAILHELEKTGPGAPAASYRLISLFGAAYRSLTRRGLLDAEAAEAMLDLEDLRAAGQAQGLAEAARARLSRLGASMGRTPRRSAPVAMALAYIKENYGRQIGLELAADSVGLSPNRLSRLIVEETGRGFSDYLIEYRIERARELLLQPGASIKQVSISCGYPDPNYFSRLFKKVTGMTPSAFSSGSSEARDEQ